MNNNRDYSSIIRYLCAVLILFFVTQNYTLAMQHNHDSIIPRSVLFGNPDKTAVKISPDGRYIGYIAPKDGVLNVYVANSDDIKSAKCITNDTKRGIRSYFFAYDNKHLLYLQDDAGDENWAIFSVNIDTLEEKKLTKERVHAGISGVSKKYPDQILVQLNSRDPAWHDIYKLNIVSGEQELIYENNEYMGIISDDDFNLRFAMKQDAEGVLHVYKFNKDLTLEKFDTIPSEDFYTTSIITFNKENNAVYTIDSRNRDIAALFELNLDTKEKKLIYSNEKADISDIMLHPIEKNILFTKYNYLREEIVVLDKSIAKDIEYLKSVVRGDLEIISMTHDAQQWIIADSRDDAAVSYYRYNRSLDGVGTAEFLFKNRKDLSKYQLSRMHPVLIKARDGLDLVSYLTLPVDTEKKEELAPREPLPLVLFVHGGPTARDEWGYDSTHQWLANRGYAVLSVNYRGSTGFGKSFINAGNAEWAGKMHDDLIDAVDWAIKNKITKKGNVAIMGGSYGGYAALVGLTFTPDVFACAVDIVGPSSLETLLNTIPPYWKPALTALQIKIGGDQTTEEGRKFLASRSPITYIDRITKPLLIGQGANDPRVKQSESDQIVEAMAKKNIPVTYVLYPDEGHGFARPENRLSFFAVTEGFLAEYLHGRFENINCDFDKSSVIMKYGKEFLPNMKGICEAGAK